MSYHTSPINSGCIFKTKSVKILYWRARFRPSSPSFVLGESLEERDPHFAFLSVKGKNKATCMRDYTLQLASFLCNSIHNFSVLFCNEKSMAERPKDLIMSVIHFYFYSPIFLSRHFTCV